MSSRPVAPRVIRFGLFELDLSAGELCKQDRNIKLQDQPFQVLELLLRRPGEVVTREQLQHALWSTDTFVEFDQALNTAIKKIRVALGDSADKPRFIETIPRRGYRFLAPVDGATNGADTNKLQELETIATGSVQRLEHHSWQILPWAMVALSLGLAAAVVRFRQQPTNVHVLRFQVPPPEGSAFEDTPSISPDGKQLALLVSTRGQRSLWIRRLDSLSARPLKGTEGASGPFWSPDSRFIGFFAQGKLKKIDGAGGTPLTLCEAPGGFYGTWSRKGVIVFVQYGLLYLLPAGGGRPTLVTVAEQSRQRWPNFLPDGRHFLYQSLDNKRENDGIYVGALDSKETTRLLGNGDSTPEYAKGVSGRGYLFFVRDGNLMVQSFDANNLQLSGEPVAIAERIADKEANPFDYSPFSVSNNGVIARQTEAAHTQLVWFDRSGRALGTVDMAGYKVVPKLSPDEKQVALERNDPHTGKLTVWLLQLARGTASRFTPEGEHSYSPVWSPDGRRVVYASLRDGIRNLYQMSSSGALTEELVLKLSQDFSFPTDWSSDGKFIAYTSESTKTKADLWVLPLEGNRKAFPFLQTEFNEMYGRFSHDGRWMAYTSDESGKWEVYVRHFSRPTVAEGKWQISTQGGIHPIWRRDGRELFYISADRKLMVVDVKAGERKGGLFFEPSIPKALFDTGTKSSTALPYAVTANGQRFLVVTQAAEVKRQPITVELNWSAALQH